MRDAATALGVDPFTWILAGGDDHAFVATFPGGTALPDTWTAIGRVLPASLFPGEGVTVDGRRWTTGSPGWDHFRQ
jgi:thiamine-monophosphate kinase